MLNKFSKLLYIYNTYIKYRKNILLLISAILTTSILISLLNLYNVRLFNRKLETSVKNELCLVLEDYMHILYDNNEFIFKDLEYKLSAITKKYGDIYNESSRLAYFEIGNINFKTKNYIKAEEIFTKLIECKLLSDDFYSLVLIKLGQTKEILGKYYEAAGCFNNAAMLSGPQLGRLLLMDQARVLNISGNKTRALKIYNGITTIIQDPIISKTARIRLSSIKHY